MAYLSNIPTYFILLNIVLISKRDFPKLIIMALILDLIFLNTYFINTLVLTIVFTIYKKINFVHKYHHTNYTIILNKI